MPDALFRHQTHTFLHWLVWTRDSHIARHDFVYPRFSRALAAQKNFAGVIALGNNPDDFLALQYQEGADIFCVHHFDGLENRRGRRDGINLGAFFAKNRANCSAYIHKTVMPLNNETKTLVSLMQSKFC